MDRHVVRIPSRKYTKNAINRNCQRSRRDTPNRSVMCEHFAIRAPFLSRVSAHRRKSRASAPSYRRTVPVNTHGRCRPVSPRGVNLGHGASASGLEISCERTHEARERSSTINPRATEMRLTYMRERGSVANYIATNSKR